MNLNKSRHRLALPLLVLAAFVWSSTAQSAEPRRFEPVPQSKAQIVQVLKDSTIITTAGKRIDAGASMAPDSAKATWLAVSVKNTSTTPLSLGGSAIQVVAGDQPLPMRTAEDALKPVNDKNDGYVRDRCALATASSMRNCSIDMFNQKQAKRIDEASKATETEQLAPGQLRTQQFQVDLPKKSKSAPVMLKVNITVDGEQLVFDFKEVD
jgi:hypothetical protein